MVTTVAVGLAVGALALGTPALAASATPVGGGNHITTIGPTTVSSKTTITTPADLTAFELSASPKVITIDPLTNTVVSVTETTATVSPNGISNPCASGAICWQTSKPPLANWGFSGVGTYTGNWQWRSTMNSHNWGGQLTYTINNSGASSTTPVFGHNSTINFTNPTVNNITGLKVVVNA